MSAPTPTSETELTGVSGPQKSEKAARAEARTAKRLDAADRKAARLAARQARGPGVWRGVIWPLLKLAVALVIAVALVKLAFFPDTTAEAGGGEVPTAVMEEPEVVASLGTIRNDLQLQGQVVPDAAVPIRSTHAGTITRVIAENGQTVAAGAALYVVRTETQSTTPGADGSLPAPVIRSFTITAPSDGVLSNFDVLVNQSVEVATETGAVRPASFHIEAPLTAAQQYRLTTQPADAQVQIPGGPAPFTCAALAVVQPTNDAGQGGDPSMGGAVSTATATCSIPADVRVFSGLAADVTIAAGVAENVLTLPVTAVLGSADSGVAFRLDEAGEPVELPVQLGLNDGRNVEIRGGLAEGDSVLQFAPGSDADACADPATADPMICGEMLP